MSIRSKRTIPGICCGVLLAWAARVPRGSPRRNAGLPGRWPGAQEKRQLTEVLIIRPSSRRTPPRRFPPCRQAARVDPRRALAQGRAALALTFDLCSNANEIAGYDGEIIDTLRRLGVKATFFASGKWLLDHKERGEQLIADPLFEVGSHSWTHRNFRLLPEGAAAADLALNLAADASVRRDLAARACYRPGARHGAHNAVPLSLRHL